MAFPPSRNTKPAGATQTRHSCGYQAEGSASPGQAPRLATSTNTTAAIAQRYERRPARGRPSSAHPRAAAREPPGRATPSDTGSQEIPPDQDACRNTGAGLDARARQSAGRDLLLAETAAPAPAGNLPTAGSMQKHQSQSLRTTASTQHQHSATGHSGGRGAQWLHPRHRTEQECVLSSFACMRWRRMVARSHSRSRRHPSGRVLGRRSRRRPRSRPALCLPRTHQSGCGGREWWFDREAAASPSSLTVRWSLGICDEGAAGFHRPDTPRRRPLSHRLVRRALRAALSGCASVPAERPVGA